MPVVGEIIQASAIALEIVLMGCAVNSIELLLVRIEPEL
jgi:hypothetical protein